MGRKVLIPILVMLVVIFGGCAKKSTSNSSTVTVPQESRYNGSTASSGSEKYAADSGKIAGSTESKYTSQVSYSEQSSVSDYGQKVIYNASSLLEVKEVKIAYDAICERTTSSGGYVAVSSLGDNYSEVTCRVPSEKLNDFLSFLNTVGEQKDLSTSTNDITDQYTDAKSRLSNFKAQEEQLLAIMKKANTIEEILKVQDELSKVRGEIEVLQGRINMWDKLVAMSTVVVRINKIQEIGGKKTVKLSFISWGEIARGISNGFNSTLNFIVRFLSGLVIFIISAVPILPFIAVIVWLILRYRKRIRKNNGK